VRSTEDGRGYGAVTYRLNAAPSGRAHLAGDELVRQETEWRARVAKARDSIRKVACDL